MVLPFQKNPYKKFSNEELICCAQKDDLKAIEELVKREQRNVYATLYYMDTNKDELLDNTQEVLLKMIRSIKNLKNPQSFKCWLNQIIIHFYYDYVRKKKRKPQLVPIENVTENNEVTSSYEAKLIDTKTKPDETTLSKELEDAIFEAIRKLPPILKIAIILREFQGLSYDEIANATNTNVGTVKSRIARARNRIQDSLKEYIA